MEQRIPFSAEAERAVLGALLRDEKARSTVFGELSEEDLYIKGNQLIFRAAAHLNNTGKPVDLVTLLEHLQSRAQEEEAGGFEYITGLPMALPMLSRLPHYIEIVKEKSTLRRLISGAEEILSLATGGEEELQFVLAESEKKIFEISMEDMKRDLAPISADVVAQYMALGEIKGIGGVTGLSTGFADLDRMLSGLHRSDLIIVAARPAMGKTSFAMNIAQYAGLYRDAVTAVFSLEMSRDQLIHRMLCSEARVDMSRLKSGQMTDQDWTKLSNVLGDFSKSKIYIDDTAGITVAEVASKLRRLKIETGGKLDLVLIDYLQLMTYRGHAQNRQQEVSEMSRALKILARELDVPIVLLSQLSRAPEQRANRRPMMSDLRESGAIEQDADVILMLYRSAAYAEPDDEVDNTAEVIVAKHRNGPTGTVEMLWLGEYTRFQSMDPGYRGGGDG